MTVRPVHLLLVLAPLTGCMRPDRASLEMFGICAPPAASSCSYGGTCSAYQSGKQIVDVDMTDSLFLPVETHNQMAANADDSGHVNTHDALVQQVEVSYSAAGISVGTVTTDLQQAVPAGGSAVLALDILNSAAGASFRAGLAAGALVDAIADVKLKGVLVDGSKFETGSYRVPVEVCRGCLSGFYVCTDPTQSVTAVCPAIGQAPASIACGKAGSFDVGGAVTGFQAGGTLSVTCTIDGVPQTATVLTGDGPFTCGAGGTGSSFTMVIAASGQTCTFNTSGTTSRSGSVAGAAVNETITCAP